MGCLGSKETEAPKPVEKPTFSWEKREKLDPKDYTIADLNGKTAGRKPGTINGQQFFIQNCQDCTIYLYDHTATVMVDDCINCKIFIGPSKGSVFLRDCKDCAVAVACQQFRTRDCKKMDVFLFCATQPIIESSTGMKFGCFVFFYPELEDQFKAAGLSVYNNNWSNIHDFTPAEGEATWMILPQATTLSESIPTPDSGEFGEVQVSTDYELSTVPLSHGSRRKPHDESCLVVFFHASDVKKNVRQFLHDARNRDNSCILIQSKEVRMKPEDVERVFQSEKYAAFADRGPVIGLEMNGQSCVADCTRAVGSIAESSIELQTYISPDPSKAVRDIDSFYNFVDMSMN